MSFKVVRFLEGGPALADEVRAGWKRVLGTADAPTQASLSVALELPGLPRPRFAAVEIAWFDDQQAARAHRATRGDALAVAVDEVVLRGELVNRSAASFKMMSVARRNPDLTATEFSDRWKAEAGRMGSEIIPEDVRGLAYVQDRPVDPDATPFDAINEVWFDRLEDLQRRAEWFAARPVPAELFAPFECFALYLREELVPEAY